MDAFGDQFELQRAMFCRSSRKERAQQMSSLSAVKSDDVASPDGACQLAEFVSLVCRREMNLATGPDIFPGARHLLPSLRITRGLLAPRTSLASSVRASRALP